MKTVDFKQYNEKLKINPVAADQFDDLHIDSIRFVDAYYKKDLETYDIVLINDYLFMTFIGNDYEQYTNYFDSISSTNEGVFMYAGNRYAGRIEYMRLTSYTYDLKRSNNNMDWDIRKVYKHTNSFKGIDDISQIDQECLNDIIKEYHFKQIVIKI